MIDIAAVREAFYDNVISDIALVRSKNDIADALTKYVNQVAICAVMHSGQISINCEQWIKRRNKNAPIIEDHENGNLQMKVNVENYAFNLYLMT